jgi:hypothetical protein
VVKTDANGDYRLPAYDGMTVFVTKPAGWEVPLDEQNFPQFFYHHLPKGSPPLRFDGLPPTGPLPQRINFPMVRTVEDSRPDSSINCAVIGDTQTYSNQELGFLRDGVVNDLAKRDDLGECGALIVGDVAGDDLGLYPRIKEVMSLANIPYEPFPATTTSTSMPRTTSTPSTPTSARSARSTTPTTSGTPTSSGWTTSSTPAPVRTTLTATTPSATTRATTPRTRGSSASSS